MSSGLWLRCPNRRCGRSIQIYPGRTQGYFLHGKTADCCLNCGAAMRLCEDEDGLFIALGSWSEHEFKNRWVDIEGPPPSTPPGLRRRTPIPKMPTSSIPRMPTSSDRLVSSR